MNAISGFGGFDPSAIQQKMQDKFASADTDKDGALSVDEATAMAEAAGRDGKGVDKLFSTFDSDGDGLLSGDEQSQMMEQLEARKEQLKEMLTRSTEQGQGGQFEQLLESLKSDDGDDDEDNPTDLSQLFADNASKDDTLSYLAKKLPPIDTFA